MKGYDKIEVEQKIIPLKYKDPILEALSYYPELNGIAIYFILVRKHLYPYSSRPSFSSFFKKPSNRRYIIALVEEAQSPELFAIFSNLPYNAKVTIIGHELAHIVQYNSLFKIHLLKLIWLYPLHFFKRRFETAADAITIEHGLGAALYEFTVYIRSIPGYVNKRPGVNKFYLKPHEIMERIHHRWMRAH